MKINKVRWKNFTSWGNSWQELKFDDNPKLNLICGQNGSGKSSIFNLIIYMLYGQVDGFTQKDIPNRVNKHFEGEIEIEANNKHVIIKRSISPNNFNVCVDGKDIDTVGKNNVQKYLENEIYRMSYSIFRNSIVLSINDFKTFVDLSQKEKRDIIDRIFGYSVINTASEKVKELVKGVVKNISEIESRVDGYHSSIETINGKIKQLEWEKTQPKVNLESEELSKVVSKLGENARDYKKILEYIKQNDIDTNDAATKYNELYENYNTLNSNYNDARRNVNDIKGKLSLYNNNKCPTCGTDLTSGEHPHIKDDLTKTLKTMESLLESATTSLNDTRTNVGNAKNNVETLKAKGRELSNKKDNIVSSINALKVRKATLESKINEHKKSEDNQIEEYNKLILEIRNKIEPEEATKHKLEKKNEVLGMVGNIFSENGLKQYIANIYVPFINDCVFNICEKLGIKYKIVFDTNYDCEILYLGEPINYKTLSNGERKKVDVAVTLAFLQIIKTKISDINLLFLDEVLSSIDVSSCNEMLKIFNEFAKEIGISIYIVHHANLDSSYVDNVIEIEKNNGFSHFVE